MNRGITSTSQPEPGRQPKDYSSYWAAMLFLYLTAKGKGPARQSASGKKIQMIWRIIEGSRAFVVWFSNKNGIEIRGHKQKHIPILTRGMFLSMGHTIKKNAMKTKKKTEPECYSFSLEYISRESLKYIYICRCSGGDFYSKLMITLSNYLENARFFEDYKT